jgi:serine/threonine protein phosphatase 1
MPRTFAIGDIHGEAEHLSRLLARLPALLADDTVVFLGDYIDRGTSSRQVIEQVEGFRERFHGRLILLRGNHEDAWLKSLIDPNPGFLLPEGNGCLATMHSFLDCSQLSGHERVRRLLSPHTWFPQTVHTWMETLGLWYEDEHAIYVHAGLDGEGDTWLHPSLGKTESLMWMRERDFYTRYRGKRVVFGHTPTHMLGTDHLNFLQRIFDDRTDVWQRGDLIGVDTGCGKGGFLSAVELPSGKVYESRG